MAKSNLKWFLILPSIIFFVFLSNIAFSADFDVTVVSQGESSVITITNNLGLPAYVSDLLKADGTSIGIHEDVDDSITLEISGEPVEIVEARCVPPSHLTPPEDDGYFEYPKNMDGFYRFTAEIIN